jgi:Glycogen recognition site of AMP-activated protein kinase
LAAAQFKFVVDGNWRYDPWLPIASDEDGNLNNVLEVLDPETSFALPPDFDEPQDSLSRCGALGALALYLSHHTPPPSVSRYPARSRNRGGLGVLYISQCLESPLGRAPGGSILCACIRKAW